jgi:hypothetical protein
MATPAKPTRRNPIVTIAVPVLPAVAAEILDRVLELPMAVFVSAIVAGGLLGLFMLARMVRELRSVTGNHAFAWWPVLVPIYQMYWTAVVLQAEVAKAKAMRGAPEARDSFVYLCLFVWALVEDLNDLAD